MFGKQELITQLDRTNSYTSLKKANSLSRGTSLGRTLSDTEVEVIESNAFLASLLNENGLIIIGEYAFKNLKRYSPYETPKARRYLI